MSAKFIKDEKGYPIGVIPKNLIGQVLSTIPSSVTTVANAISNIYSQLSARNIPTLYPVNYSVFWEGHDRYYGEAILYGNDAHLTLIGYNVMYICDVDNGTISYKTVAVT